MVLLAPPSPGEPCQCPGGRVPGAGSGGGPWSHGGGLLPRPYTPSFPPSLSPQSSASSITATVSILRVSFSTGTRKSFLSFSDTARGGQVPDGQGRFPRAPRRASPPQARLWHRETPGCFSCLAAGTRASRAGAWAGSRLHVRPVGTPGPARKELERGRPTGLWAGLLPGAPRGSAPAGTGAQWGGVL